MAGAVSTVIERLRNYVKRYNDPYSCHRVIEGTEDLMSEAADMLEHQMFVIQNNNFDKVAIREMDAKSIEVIAEGTDKVRRIFLTEKGTQFTKTFYQDKGV